MRWRRGWVGRHIIKICVVGVLSYFLVTYYLFAIWRYYPACERNRSVVVAGQLTEHFRNFAFRLLANEGFNFIYTSGTYKRKKYKEYHENGNIYVIYTPFLQSSGWSDHDELFVNYEWRYIDSILYQYNESGARPALAERIIAALDQELAKHTPTDRDDFMAVEVNGKKYPNALLRECSVLRAALIVPGTGPQQE